MDKKINIFGITANSLIIIAVLMAFYNLPNQLLVIVAAVLIMTFGTYTFFLIQRNVLNPKMKWLNILAFIFLLLFTISLLIFLTKIPIIRVIPFKAISLITFLFVLWYLFNEIYKKRLSIKNVSFLHYFLLFILLLFVVLPVENQLADIYYKPNINNPAYNKNKGSVIYIDAGHNNYHTLKDRLYSTGKLLERDGYQVFSYNQKINLDSLKKCKIFIIVNALNEKNDKWETPIYSAFTKKEINDITQWVSEGGSLFLVADHMPFAGAASDLASNFGFKYENGHAKHFSQNRDYFTRKTKTLGNNTITNGRNNNEKIDSILTFSGSAFTIPDSAISILKFDTTWYNYNPKTAWNYDGIEPFSIKGYSQGAYKSFGKGRIVVFGEAMMFTAQLGGGFSFMKLGMNSKDCPDNHILLLNIIHWLDRII